jgi:hypothetical protein
MRIVANRSSTEEPATGTVAAVDGFVVDATPGAVAVVVAEIAAGEVVVAVGVP